ncbi:hypothetical protein KL949_003273 [Ogataea haglerorum]|nr:hypothetical protein KL913_003324 [Ogataea haglerorum]KAG7717439.1 hypothetical protein KL949_003273 [Ogataea haglerorum]KAG7729620.1 hypothetical protein KL948_003774 [Ogataea haglerorum]KAG7766357.1 hypothetical protein KL931_004195 [Ogataea haglerorum]
MDFEAILTLKTPGDDLADQGLFRPWSMKQRQHDKEPAADSAVFFSKSDTFKSFSVNDPMENYFSLAERKNDNFFTGHDDSFTEQSITPTKHNVASRLGTTARVPSLRYDLAPPRFAGLFETLKPETPFQPGARNTRASSFAVQSFPFMERVPLRPAAETSRPSSKRELSAHLESSKSVRHRRKSVSLFLTQLFDKFLQKKDEAPKSARSIKSVKSYNFLNQSADIYNEIIDYYNDASNVERGRRVAGVAAAADGDDLRRGDEHAVFQGPGRAGRRGELCEHENDDSAPAPGRFGPLVEAQDDEPVAQERKPGACGRDPAGHRRARVREKGVRGHQHAAQGQGTAGGAGDAGQIWPHGAERDRDADPGGGERAQHGRDAEAGQLCAGVAEGRPVEPDPERQPADFQGKERTQLHHGGGHRASRALADAGVYSVHRVSRTR